MPDQLPQIRVLGFKTSYEKLPVKGDPMTDKCNPHGYKVDAAGNVIKELQAEDYVTYAPSHSPMNTQVTERVRLMIPDHEKMGDDTDGAKLGFFVARWNQIEPAYEAFKQGREIPVNGTPLGAWAGITPEQGEVLRMSGIRTVEEVRDLAEGMMSRVRLPNVRELSKQAKLFLENSSAAKAAEREAQKDAVIEEMASQLAALRERIESDDKPKRGRKPREVEHDEEEVAA